MDWRIKLEDALGKLKDLPEGSDRFSAHRPLDSIIAMAREAAGQISRDDLPIPFVAAGADGAIQIKWRRESSEFSLFFEPNESVEYLFVRHGHVSDGELAINDFRLINEFVDQLLD